MEALYYSHSSIDGASLDQMALSLLFFTDSVYVKEAYEARDPQVGAKLRDYAEAGLVKPWAFPRGDVGVVASWTSSRDTLVIPDDDYDTYADLVKASVEEYVDRSQRRLRLADLADLTNELWAECVSAALGADEVLGTRGRAQPILVKAENQQYDISVVTRFLQNQRFDVGLGVLSVGDLLDLRSRYREPVGRLLAEALEGLPGAGVSPAAAIEVALKRLLSEYNRELQEVIKAAQPRLSATALGAGVDVSALFVTPIGFYSIFSRLTGYRSARRKAPLVWFVSESRRRMDVSRGVV